MPTRYYLYYVTMKKETQPTVAAPPKKRDVTSFTPTLQSRMFLQRMKDQGTNMTWVINLALNRLEASKVKLKTFSRR